MKINLRQLIKKLTTTFPHKTQHIPENSRDTVTAHPYWEGRGSSKHLATLPRYLGPISAPNVIERIPVNGT